MEESGSSLILSSGSNFKHSRLLSLSRKREQIFFLSFSKVLQRKLQTIVSTKKKVASDEERKKKSGEIETSRKKIMGKVGQKERKRERIERKLS